MELPTYDYYTNTYGGSMSEIDFNHSLKKAQYKTNELISYREIPDEMVEQVKYFICELIYLNQIYGVKTAYINASTVKSEETDGYKVTYMGQEAVKIDNLTQYNKLLRELKIEYLSMPANLVYCGI